VRLRLYMSNSFSCSQNQKCNSNQLVTNFASLSIHEGKNENKTPIYRPLFPSSANYYIPQSSSAFSSSSVSLTPVLTSAYVRGGQPLSLVSSFPTFPSSPIQPPPIESKRSSSRTTMAMQIPDPTSEDIPKTPRFPQQPVSDPSAISLELLFNLCITLEHQQFLVGVRPPIDDPNSRAALKLKDYEKQENIYWKGQMKLQNAIRDIVKKIKKNWNR